jgi:hypothetical protein
MWGRKNKSKPAESEEVSVPPSRLKDAIRQVRIETAERTGVVVDLRDAEVARLELVNDALDSVFAEVPAEIDLFDRGVSKGEVPRLWIDVISYVVMGRDKRIYRFVQDTRFGRKVLLESPSVPEVVEAVTRYVAGRLVERERALANTIDATGRLQPQRRGWRAFRAFLFGVIVGIVALIAAAVMLMPG